MINLTQGTKALIATLSFIGLLGGAVATIPVLEPWAPATRSFARAVVAAAQAADADQQKAIEDAIDQTAVGILDLKLVALDGQIVVLNNSLGMLVLRLADDPGDPLLTSLKTKLEADIKLLNDQRVFTACDKQRKQFDLNKPCP